MEFLLLTFYCNFGLAEENRSLYQGLRYVPEKPLWRGNNKVCMYVYVCSIVILNFLLCRNWVLFYA